MNKSKECVTFFSLVTGLALTISDDKRIIRRRSLDEIMVKKIEPSEKHQILKLFIEIDTHEVMVTTTS